MCCCSFKLLVQRNLKGVVFALFLLAAIGFYYYCYFILNDVSRGSKTNDISIAGKGRMLFDLLNNSRRGLLSPLLFNDEDDKAHSQPFKSAEEDLLIAVHSRNLKYLNSLIVTGQPTYAGAQTYVDYTIIRLGLKHLANVRPLRPAEYDGIHMIVNDVTAFKYSINIPKCEDEDESTTANRTLFIAILSAPNNFEKRQVIRETWLRHVTDLHYTRGLLDVIGYGFVVGQTTDQLVQSKIEKESKNHSDILQVEMNDSYRNLTRKVVAILNWVNSNCAQAHFVMKIDDDGYINVHNFATVLAHLSPTEISVYGKQIGNNIVYRTSSKLHFYRFNLSLHVCVASFKTVVRQMAVNF